MKIQVNSDKQITADNRMVESVEAEVERALGRFENQLTRVEVHLSDVNSSSKQQGQLDKRCVVEARQAGKKPISADYQGTTVKQAVKGASGKMKRLLETAFGQGCAADISPLAAGR